MGIVGYPCCFATRMALAKKWATTGPTLLIISSIQPPNFEKLEGS